MLYGILFLLLLGLTLSTIGLYLVRRDWNDPELRELAIIWVYFSLAFIEAGAVLLFFAIAAPPTTSRLTTETPVTVSSVGHATTPTTLTGTNIGVEAVLPG